jgi:hypothetical protein
LPFSLFRFNADISPLPRATGNRAVFSFCDLAHRTVTGKELDSSSTCNHACRLAFLPHSRERRRLKDGTLFAKRSNRLSSWAFLPLGCLGFRLQSSRPGRSDFGFRFAIAALPLFERLHFRTLTAELVIKQHPTPRSEKVPRISASATRRSNPASG